MRDRPCTCDTCHLCARFWHSAAFRRAYGYPADHGPIPATVPALTPPTVKHVPAERKAATVRTPKPKTLARSLPCLHFGPLVDVPGCRPCKAYHVCEIGEYGGKCRGGVECQTCERYEADEP